MERRKIFTYISIEHKKLNLKPLSGDKRSWTEAPPAVPRRANRNVDSTEERDSGVSVDAHAYTNADDHRHHHSGEPYRTLQNATYCPADKNASELPLPSFIFLSLKV